MIAAVAAGRGTYQLAASQISSHVSRNPLERGAHPTLFKLENLAFDIAENFRDAQADQVDWKLLKQTFKDYSEGNWEPTCWILTAIYGEYADDGGLTQSHGAAVKHKSGKPVIETATPVLEKALAEAIEKVNTEQTDQRFLQNLAHFVPPKVGKYKLMNVVVTEYLTKPYYPNQ